MTRRNRRPARLLWIVFALTTFTLGGYRAWEWLSAETCPESPLIVALIDSSVRHGDLDDGHLPAVPDRCATAEVTASLDRYRSFVAAIEAVVAEGFAATDGGGLERAAAELRARDPNALSPSLDGLATTLEVDAALTRGAFELALTRGRAMLVTADDAPFVELARMSVTRRLVDAAIARGRFAEALGYAESLIGGYDAALGNAGLLARPGAPDDLALADERARMWLLVGGVMTRLGTPHDALAALDGAAAAFERASATFIRTHADLLAEWYLDIDDRAGAESALRGALARTSATDAPELSEALGYVLASRGDAAGAIDAWATTLAVPSERTPLELAGVELAIGRQLRLLSLETEAEHFAVRAELHLMNVHEPTPRAQAPAAARVLRELALLERHRHEPRRVERIVEAWVELDARASSESSDREARHHAWRLARPSTSFAISMALELGTPGLVRLALAAAAARQGQLARERTTPIGGRLRELRLALSTRILRDGLPRERATTQLHELRQLHAAVTELQTDAELGTPGNATAPLGDTSAEVTVARLAAHLARDEVIVGFVVHPLLGRDGEASDERYAAYVLEPDAHVAWHDIGSARSVDAAVSRFLDAVHRGSDARVEGRALFGMLFGHSARRLAWYSRLTIVPEGELARVPFAALTSEDGAYLVGSHVTRVLQSPFDLLAPCSTSPARGPSVVVGGVAFGDVTEAARSAPTGTFGDLPETLREAEIVAEKFAPDDVVVLSGSGADESSLVRAAQHAHTIHLATHGYYLPELAVDASAPGFVRRLARDPLVRSGLVLAGANERDAGSIDDGLLSALEVANLDLEGTALVVLSACESGLGEATPAEGVVGLRSAFLRAGAQTVVSSLWAVDDRRTRQLMASFYGHLDVGLDVAAAMRAAQLEVMTSLAEIASRVRGAYAGSVPPHPSASPARPWLWAPFVVIGNDRPLHSRTARCEAEPGPRGPEPR